MAKIISRMNNLRKLWIWGTRIKDDGIIALTRVLSLRVLDIGWCKITDIGFKFLATMIWLEELEMNSCNKITSEGLCLLVGMIGLRKLNLNGCSVNNEVLNKLSTLEKLEELDVSECKSLVDEKIVINANGFKMLRILDMNYTNIDDKVISIVFLTNLKRLEYLDIRYTKVSNNMVKMLMGLKLILKQSIIVQSSHPPKTHYNHCY